MKSLSILAALLFCIPALRADDKATFQLKVPDMTCQSCVLSVTEEIKQIKEVSDVFVDLKTKTVIVSSKDGNDPGKSAVMEAVRLAGYQGIRYAKVDKSFADAKAELAR